MRQMLILAAAIVPLIPFSPPANARAGPSGPSQKPTLKVSEILENGKVKLQIKILSKTPPPQAFATSEAENISNFRLYEIRDPDQPEMTAKDITPLSVDTAHSPDVSEGGATVKLLLRKALEPKGSYIMEVRNYFPSTPALQAGSSISQLKARRLTAQFSLGGEIISPDAWKQRQELAIRSGVPLYACPKEGIAVQRRVFEVRHGKPEESFQELEATVQSNDGNQVNLQLKRKLPENRESSLRVSLPSALGQGQPIVAEGKVKPAGAAATEDSAKIKGTLAGNAAVHQKAVLTFIGTFVPLHPIYLGETRWQWGPRFDVDLGLRSTKSNNSITVTSPFLRTMQVSREPKPREETDFPVYTGRMEAPWYFLSNIGLGIGPRFETDRIFRRRNVLGEIRADFHFFRWTTTIEERRRLLAEDLQHRLGYGADSADWIEGINFGFSVVPYAALDFGGHVNEETVTNSKTHTSVTVPHHEITRGIAGILGKIEYRKATLSLDEAMIGLASQETIGFTTDTGVGVRRISGVQPHSKVTLDYFLDSGKHYALSLIYENGRMPPNFEYLNRVIWGLKVLY
jgi:hypothetical protein